MKHKIHFPNPASLAAGLLLLSGGLTGWAQQNQPLYTQPASVTLRNNYSGSVGCQFTTGSSNTLVSHLGYYSSNGVSGLATSHNVGIYSSSLLSPQLLAQVVVPAGTAADSYTNSFYWMHLDPPRLLSSNTTYTVAALPNSGDGDSWGNNTAPGSWNSWFVGVTAAATRNPVYASGSHVWPATGFSKVNNNNTTYIIENLGYLEVGSAHVGVQTTNASVGAGQTVVVAGFGAGQQPISYQWWLVGSPNTPLAGQTAPTLSISNASVGNYNYYLSATNALGGEQSPLVNVTVSALPVGISKQPTNFTVFANFPATFSLTVTGTPPIFLQWYSNSVAIAGANSSTYTVTPAASVTATITCFASNNIAGTPHTATSANATLTVIQNLALPQQFLHGAFANTSTNGFVGCVGGSFTTGSNATIVTHLGYFAANYTDATHASLTDNHNIYIFNADYTVNTMTTVASGTGLPVINGYIWAPLSSPVTLSPNTAYTLGADTTANDRWGNAYVVSDWSSYYTIPANGSANAARYNNTGQAPYFGGYSGQMYSAPNMAILSSGTPIIIALNPTNVTQYVGLNVTLTTAVNGAPPVTVQWFKQPGTLLAGQTNLAFNLNNAQLTDSGSYYVVASNGLSAAQSADAVVNIVPDVGPSLTNNISAQTVFQYQTLQFVAGFSGTPTITYQWTFNGSPIAGATNTTLTLNNASSTSVGNYQILATNAYGNASSSSAYLTVTIVPTNTYTGAALSPNLLAYYPLNDVVASGTATNWGSLGFAFNGTYGAGCASVAGPTGMSNFDPANSALQVFGLSSASSVAIPPSTGTTLTNCTIAAWVYDGGGQLDNSTIVFQRGGSVFGLAVGQNNGEWIKYTWNGASYGNYTGLVLPTNTWAFVAMVINPTNATIYLQDGVSMKSTNFAGTYPPQTLTGNTYIGWDTAGGVNGRLWTGNLDEVMIYNQALSSDAINALFSGVPFVLPKPTVAISQSGGNLIVTWTGSTLLQSTNVAGPYAPASGASGGSYTLPATNAALFFRAQQ